MIQGRLGFPALEANRVHRARPARRASRGRRDHPDWRGRRVRVVLEAMLAPPVLRDRRGQVAHKGGPVLPGRRASGARPVLLVRPATRAPRGASACQALPGRKAIQARRAIRGRRALPASRELLVSWVRREMPVL